MKQNFLVLEYGLKKHKRIVESVFPAVTTYLYEWKLVFMERIIH